MLFSKSKSFHVVQTLFVLDGKDGLCERIGILNRCRGVGCAIGGLDDCLNVATADVCVGKNRLGGAVLGMAADNGAFGGCANRKEDGDHGGCLQQRCYATAKGEAACVGEACSLATIVVCKQLTKALVEVARHTLLLCLFDKGEEGRILCQVLRQVMLAEEGV